MVGAAIQLDHRSVAICILYRVRCSHPGVFAVTFGNLCGSIFFAAVLVKCKSTFKLNYSSREKKELTHAYTLL